MQEPWDDDEFVQQEKKEPDYVWVWIIAGIIFFGWLFWPQINGKSDSSYPEDSPPDYSEVQGTDECTDDCSGHDAGYEWARDNDICDSSYDSGNSDSFNEGVQEWATNNC